MRVCHLVSTSLNSHYFALLGKGLAREGVSLLLGTLHPAPPPDWLAEAPGAQHFTLDAPSRRHYFQAIPRLSRLLRREGIEILQAHLFDAGMVGLLGAGLARTPVTVVTRHHTDQVRMVGTRIHQALDRWMARRADHVIVLSSAVRSYLMREEHIDGARIEVTPQGFDFAALSADETDRRRVRAEFGLDDDFVIGCIGHLYETKGHRFLLEALPALLGDIPRARLLLLGRGDRRALEGKASALGLENRLVFAGFRTDVAACIRAMDVVVHPSLSEAFCQVLVETLAVGTPLVATDVGGARDVVADGETGVLVPPADASAIVRAVLMLHRDPERRRRMALAGQERVRQRFSVENMVNAQIQCYQRWLRERDQGVRGSA